MMHDGRHHRRCRKYGWRHGNPETDVDDEGQPVDSYYFVLVPIVAYVCFREYTGSETSGLRLSLLLVVPAISVTLAATNAFHELMWYGPFVNDNGEFLTHPSKWGPWFLFVHLPYSYIVIGVAMMTLMAHSSAVAPAHRRGLFLLTAACIAPLLATAAYDVGVGPDTLSYVPLVFAAMLPIYAWLIIGEKIIEFTPLAYETVFQTMQDPVIVIDDKNRIISMNHGAESMLEVSEREAMNAPLDAVMTEGSTCVFNAMDSGQPQKVLTTTGRFLHLRVSALEAKGALPRGGQILMFRDVSDVEKAQMEVRNSEKLLRTLIDHSVNDIIRMRWVRDEERGLKELRCIFANSAAGRFLDSDPEDLNDRTVDDLVRLACAGMSGEDRFEAVRLFNKSVNAQRGIELEVCQKQSGSGRWLQMVALPVGEDIALTLIDITIQKAREDQMASIAWSDPLTGVLNRRGFERDAA